MLDSGNLDGWIQCVSDPDSLIRIRNQVNQDPDPGPRPQKVQTFYNLKKFQGHQKNLYILLLSLHEGTFKVQEMSPAP